MENLIYDRTQEDVINKSDKGYHNYTDLNRIEEWSKYISDLLNQFGYRQSVSVKTNWNIYDERTVVEIERIRINLLSIRNSISVKQDTPQVPDTLNKINIEKANAIERILADIEELINYMKQYFVYSGVSNAGQNRIWQQRFRRGRIVDSRNYLCFTANQANSTISTVINGELTTTPTLEYSTDKETWNEFVVGSTTVALSNIGDKVYLRGDNDSFSESTSNYINFVMTGSISASGNIMSLVDKTCESVIIPNTYCFNALFSNCIALTTPPQLPATDLAGGCYRMMFSGCTSLVKLPQLPATDLIASCYNKMFENCSNIKLSETQTDIYQYSYRIPTSDTGSGTLSAMSNMFTGTGGTFTGRPSLNTTYYTDNEPV